MQKGDVVTIVNQKLEEFIEGEAELVEPVSNRIDSVLPVWWVHFPNDDPGANYQRYIYPPEDVERVRTLEALAPDLSA